MRARASSRRDVAMGNSCYSSLVRGVCVYARKKGPPRCDRVSRMSRRRHELGQLADRSRSGLPDHAELESSSRLPVFTPDGALHAFVRFVQEVLRIESPRERAKDREPEGEVQNIPCLLHNVGEGNITRSFDAIADAVEQDGRAGRA